MIYLFILNGLMDGLGVKTHIYIYIYNLIKIIPNATIWNLTVVWWFVLYIAISMLSGNVLKNNWTKILMLWAFFNC